MQSVIKFLVKEVTQHKVFQLGLVKELEEVCKDSLDYNTYSLVFELITELVTTYQQQNTNEPLLHLAELLLLNLLPKRHQHSHSTTSSIDQLQQYTLFYHQYFNQKKHNQVIAILNHLVQDKRVDPLINTIHYLNQKLQMHQAGQLPYVLRQPMVNHYPQYVPVQQIDAFLFDPTRILQLQQFIQHIHPPEQQQNVLYSIFNLYEHRNQHRIQFQKQQTLLTGQDMILAIFRCYVQQYRYQSKKGETTDPIDPVDLREQQQKDQKERIQRREDQGMFKESSNGLLQFIKHYQIFQFMPIYLQFQRLIEEIFQEIDLLEIETNNNINENNNNNITNNDNNENNENINNNNDNKNENNIEKQQKQFFEQLQPHFNQKLHPFLKNLPQCFRYFYCSLHESLLHQPDNTNNNNNNQQLQPNNSCLKNLLVFRFLLNPDLKYLQNPQMLTQYNNQVKLNYIKYIFYPAQLDCQPLVTMCQQVEQCFYSLTCQPCGRQSIYCYLPSNIVQAHQATIRRQWEHQKQAGLLGQEILQVSSQYQSGIYLARLPTIYSQQYLIQSHQQQQQYQYQQQQQQQQQQCQQQEQQLFQQQLQEQYEQKMQQELQKNKKEQAEELACLKQSIQELKAAEKRHWQDQCQKQLELEDDKIALMGQMQAYSQENTQLKHFIAHVPQHYFNQNQQEQQQQEEEEDQFDALHSLLAAKQLEAKQCLLQYQIHKATVLDIYK